MTSDAAIQRIGEIQARADAATPGPWKDGQNTIGGVSYHLRAATSEDLTFISAASSDVPKLCAALRAVLELHKPHASGRFCDALTCSEDWPCSTVRAITEALGEADGS